MRIKNISTSMCIALTILFAGIVVQVTDALELFGHNSAIPVIIGLVIIVVGVVHAAAQAARGFLAVKQLTRRDLDQSIAANRDG